MMSDLEKAKRRLAAGDVTCVLCNGDKLLTSTERGIKPLVRWIESADDFSAFYAADRVVGKSAAFLYVQLKVTAVYAGVISRSAWQVLRANHIYIEYGQMVENIINRAGDDICPFEKAVLKTENVDTAYMTIRQKMAEMNIVL